MDSNASGLVSFSFINFGFVCEMQHAAGLDSIIRELGVETYRDGEISGPTWR